jgi:hypothetical protein
VTWSLINGTYASGTTLSATTGNKVTLVVDITETNSTITIRATHPGTTTANSAYQDITINIKLPVGATTFTDTNGVVWHVLKDNRSAVGTPTSFKTEDGSIETSDGSGTMLIVTEKVYGTGGLTSYGDGISYNSSDNFVQYQNSVDGVKLFWAFPKKDESCDFSHTRQSIQGDLGS